MPNEKLVKLNFYESEQDPVTVVIMSGGVRVKELSFMLSFYLRNVSRVAVPEVHLVWNSPSDILLDTELLGDKALKIHKETFNTLNNRYKHWDEIRTDAVLLLDDDCLVRDVAFATRVQRKFSNRAIIFYARSHRSGADGLAYVNPKRTNGFYSLGTGQATLIWTKWMKSFSTDARVQRIRRFIDHNQPTCEDIALHLYISNLTGLAPLLIQAGQQQLRWSRHSGMSSAEGWGDSRKRCLNDFIMKDFRGRNPLRYAEYDKALGSADLLTQIFS